MRTYVIGSYKGLGYRTHSPLEAWKMLLKFLDAGCLGVTFNTVYG